MIKAEIIADSKNEFGERITTMVVNFPRFILAELNTHRAFSRNSASSRAIPFEKMLKMVQENPFIPIAWQKDHKGMQGTEYLSGTAEQEVWDYWLQSRDEAIKYAKELNSIGVTKQLCNRLLEPFMWHKVIITSTEWENFFALRCPQYEFEGKIYRSKKDALKDIKEILGESDWSNTDDYFQWAMLNRGQAEIHMMALAEAVWDAYNESTPKELKAGEWHIPFGDNIDRIKLNLALNNVPHDHLSQQEFNNIETIGQIKIATARCARISYQTLGNDSKIDYKADIQLHDRLIYNKPPHASPAEHCAQVMDYKRYQLNGGMSRNFKGFIQYREIAENGMD